MTQATLSRGSRSVTFPVRDEAGDPLVSRDFGKPNLGVDETYGGDLDPLMGQDRAAVNEVIRINTRLLSDPYDTAIELANLIKSSSQGKKLELTLPLTEYKSGAIHVFPALKQDTALELSYTPGRGTVDATITLNRIGDLRGTDNGQRAQTPTNRSGSGPLALRRGTAASATIPRDLEVTRSIGRPNINVSQEYRDFPAVEDTRAPSSDRFSITVNRLQDATSTVSNLLDVSRTRRGRTPLTLDFQGIFNLGSFSVIEDGGASWRATRIGGRGGEVQSLPQFEFRVVRES